MSDVRFLRGKIKQERAVDWLLTIASRMAQESQLLRQDVERLERRVAKLEAAHETRIEAIPNTFGIVWDRSTFTVSPYPADPADDDDPDPMEDV